MALKYVLEPMKIGKVEIPNRVVRTAHDTGFAKDEITDDLIAYHTERAKGGCGLTILEAASVSPTSRIDMALYYESIVEGYERLMTAVRPHGMRVFQQLWHGGNLYPAADGSPPLCVSSRPGYTGLVGRPMTEGEIYGVMGEFAKTAVRCQKGGLDGVELHAAHGYLFHQFLSPLVNDRKDRWGGSFGNRIRFLIETLRAVRKATGGDFVVGVRLSASDAPGGLNEEDNRLILKTIQAENLIDFVDISKGDYFRQDTMVGTMHNPTGYEIPSSSQIGEVAKVPRIVAGRFRTLEEADQLIREGVTEMVSMVRAHIADPALVRKTRAGHPEQVRPCIGCNQGCIGGAIRTGRIGCAVNPAVGFETGLSEDLLKPTASPKKILIVGGGPAGMEAARIAATVGHKVTLAEAAADLGGRVNLAKRAPKLHTLGDITYWLEQEVYRLGVDVRLNTYMDAGDIRAEKADVVIIATGSMPRLDGFQNANPGEPARGTDLPHVISSADVFDGSQRDFGKTALVLDTIGHLESLAVVEQLLANGLDVTLLTQFPSMTPYVQSTWRDVPALERFYQLGKFTPLVRHHLGEIRKGECLVRPSQAGRNQYYAVPADTVVLVTHNEPLRQLYDELRDELSNVVLIGDALSPRDVQVAITEGHRLARAIA